MLAVIDYGLVTGHGGQMVADIQLLQGKIVDDPEERSKNIANLIQAIAIEFIELNERKKNTVPEVQVQHSEITCPQGFDL